jgi:membrane protease YdiL (CAAX protease family)
MISGAILLASACWAFTFGVSWGIFWIKIGISVIIICLYSFIWQTPSIRITARSFLFGALSAAILYGIFFLGNALAPFIVTGAGAQVGGVYDLGKGANHAFIFFLLLFLIGPGEEIFWRGFLQKNLMRRFGDYGGFIACTAVYAGVHLFSFNFMLTTAAFVAGGFWGLLYLWKRDVGLVIVSHSLWSAFIFSVFPIR